MYQTAYSWGSDSYVPQRRTIGNGDPMERIERLASENAVVIFSISTCCMCHAIKRLFSGLGVNPTVYELDHDPRGVEMEMALLRLLINNIDGVGGRSNSISNGSSSSSAAAVAAVPVVFVGGKLVGAMDRVMASHINGSLVPLLKEAGALWL